MLKKKRVKEKVAAVSISVLSYGYNKVYDSAGRGFYFNADNIFISEEAIKLGIIQDTDCKKIAEAFLIRYPKEAKASLPAVGELAGMIKKKVVETKIGNRPFDNLRPDIHSEEAPTGKEREGTILMDKARM